MTNMLNHPRAIVCCILISPLLINAEIAIRAPVGGTFRLHFYPQSLENPVNCTLVSPRNVITQIPLNYEGGDENLKVEPIGNGQCGAIVRNTFSNTDAGRWTLTLSNGEESIQEIFRIATVAWEQPVNRTTSVAIGTLNHVLLCGPSNNMLYGELRDPSGNLVHLSLRTRCHATIQRVLAAHLGVWTCRLAVVGGHEEIYATHTLVGIENQVSISANETSLGTLVSWQVQGLTAASLWCRAFAPNGETILVLPGMDNSRYLSTGTNLAAHKCDLIIKGDFPKELHGLWRLEMGVNIRRAMGGFIRMPEGLEDRNTVTKLSGPKKNTELNVTAGTNFRIDCQANYSASYCWIGGPNDQIYTQSENLTIGHCSQLVNVSTVAEHDGIWTCNMAHVLGGAEEQFVTKVNVLEGVFRASNPEIEVQPGNKTVIACSSVLEFPLDYCRFVRPDGTGFSIMPDMSPLGRYSYEGAGLVYGYCGLSISSVEPVDIGKWKCASRSRSRLWEAEAVDSVILKVAEATINSAFSSPLFVCGIILATSGAIISIILAAILLHKRKTARRDSQETIIVKSTK